MPAILWTALRQMEALKDGVGWCLAGKAIPSDPAEIQQWLSNQDVPIVRGFDRAPSGVRVDLPSMIVNCDNG